MSNLRVFAHEQSLSSLNLAGVNFLYPVTLAGSTQHFNSYFVPSLGANGQTVAQAVLAGCEKDYQTLCQYFGINVPHFNVIVAPLSHAGDGTGGAFHQTCLSSDLYCDIQTNPNLNSPLTQALMVAEAVEVFEAVQNIGWACGASNGEGLSRVLAQEAYPNVITGGYLTAKVWLNSSRVDWVNFTASTDQSSEANGCSVLFLYWLKYVENFSWAQICQAGSNTLAGTYWKLTGKTDAFARFKASIDLLGNKPFNGDNPFAQAVTDGTLKAAPLRDFSISNNQPIS